MHLVNGAHQDAQSIDCTEIGIIFELLRNGDDRHRVIILANMHAHKRTFMKREREKDKEEKGSNLTIIMNLRVYIFIIIINITRLRIITKNVY